MPQQLLFFLLAIMPFFARKSYSSGDGSIAHPLYGVDVFRGTEVPGLFLETKVGWCRPHVGNAPLLAVGNMTAGEITTEGWQLAAVANRSGCANLRDACRG